MRTSIYLIGFILLVVKLQAQSHYVSPTGTASWTQATNVSTPCSIETANDNFTAGDTVYYRGGTYYSGITPSDNTTGTPSDNIVLTNYPDETPVIDMQNDDYSNLDDVSYLLLQGITFKNPLGDYAVYASGYDNPPIHSVTIKNCTFIGGAIYCDMGENIQILNCNISDTPGAGIVFYGSELHKLTKTRIENCVLTNTGNDAITLHADDGHNNLGSYHLIKNNIVNGVLDENCYDITSGDHIVLDGNVSIGCPESGINIGGNVASNQVKWVRVINHISYDLGWGGEHIYVGGYGNEYINVSKCTVYGQGENAILVDGGDAYMNEIRIFNNTVNGGDLHDLPLVQINNEAYNLIFLNNILYFDEEYGGMEWNLSPLVTSYYSDYNLYWHTTLSPGYIDIWYPDENLTDICNTYGQECNALEANPMFTDVANNNYHLQSTSPAIDAGNWLTYITSESGSGTSFVVVDALWFYDGWNIEGETGDTIKTQSGQTAVITSIDYTTNTINLNQSISWTQNESVATNYSGTKPDIGAFEHSDITNISTHKSNSLAVFPNPTKGIIYFSNDLTNNKYKVFSNLGRLVKSGIINKNELLLDDLNSGIYFIKIVDSHNEEMKTIKLIME